MQIVITPPGEEEPRVTLTARVLDEPVTCSLCGQRHATWFDDPASDTATNPDASPLNAPETCDPCLTMLIHSGTVAVVDVDTRSF